MTTQPSVSSLTLIPQHLAVEPGESARVGAVDHCLFEVSDHTESMSACQRQPLPLTGKITMRLTHGERQMRMPVFAARPALGVAEFVDRPCDR